VFIDLPRSAQHVSDKIMSIMRSVRLQITACGMVSCKDVYKIDM
jgi:hypothetical protein